MNNLLNARYIVTDVETTGSNPTNDRITEIACVIVENGEIVSEKVTLVNPHKEIPPYITKMTGITQSMVQKAPEEYEVFDTFSNIFSSQNSIFVAHNVQFDYAFISNFYKRAYKTFDMPQLCTLKLARKILPNDTKKNVGDMSRYFGIRLTKRHRALIDAKATAMSLIEMLILAYKDHRINSINDLLIFQNKPTINYKIPRDIVERLTIRLDNIPYQPGVFQFFDKNDYMIFWDFSFNLNEKMKSIFKKNNINSKYFLDILSNTHSVYYKTCESELSALILRHEMIENDLDFEFNFEYELFGDIFNNRKNIKIPHNFIYLQAQENDEKIIDIYLIINGKLKYQKSYGLKAPIDTLLNKIKQLIVEININNTDYKELKVIYQWIEMQNNSGILIELNDFDYQNLSNIIRQKMLEVYENYKSNNLVDEIY